MCRPSAHDQVFSTTSRREENTSSGRGEDNNDFYHVYLQASLSIDRSVARSRSELVTSRQARDLT